MLKIFFLLENLLKNRAQNELILNSSLNELELSFLIEPSSNELALKYSIFIELGLKISWQSESKLSKVRLNYTHTFTYAFQMGLLIFY